MNYLLILQHFKMCKQTYMTQKMASLLCCTRVYPNDIRILQLTCSGERIIIVAERRGIRDYRFPRTLQQ